MQRWRGMLLLVSLAGYPFTAALSGLVGSDSSVPSVLIRVLTAGLGLVLFLATPVRLDLSGRVFMISWLAFWTLYLSRVLYDGFARTVLMPLSGSEFLAYALTFSILPVLGALGRLEPRHAERLLKQCIAACTVTLVIAAYVAFKLLSNLSDLLSSRVQLEKLNPISLGMLGGSTLILIVSLWTEHLPRRWYSWLLSVTAMAVSIAALAFSGSKGPLLATLVALAISFALPLTPARLMTLLGAGTAFAALFLSLIPMLAKSVDIALISRLDTLISGQSVDQSNVLHLLAYKAAWNQFVSSPIWGDAIVENELHFYPHNVFLDVAMSTGLLGLCSFGLVFAMSLARTWMQLSARAPYRWIHVLNLQYMVSAQTAGGVYIASLMWIFMVAAYFAGGIRHRAMAGRVVMPQAAPITESRT